MAPTCGEGASAYAYAHPWRSDCRRPATSEATVAHGKPFAAANMLRGRLLPPPLLSDAPSLPSHHLSFSPSNSRFSSLFAHNISFNYYKTINRKRSKPIMLPRCSESATPRRALRPPPPGHKRSDRGTRQALRRRYAPGARPPHVTLRRPRFTPPLPSYRSAYPTNRSPIYCPSNFPQSSLFAYNFSLNYYNTINKITKAHHRAWRQQVCHPASWRGSDVFFLLSQGLRLGLRKVSPLAGLGKFAPPRPLDAPAWQAARLGYATAVNDQEDGQLSQQQLLT